MSPPTSHLTRRTAALTPRCFILFSTTPSWLSRAIRWATSAPVSHVALAYECSTTGRTLVMEAAGGGFRGLTWERWLGANQLLAAYRIAVAPRRWQQALAGFCDTLGAPYDVRRLTLELLAHVTGGFTTRFACANPQQNARGVLCSDAIADFLHRLDFSQFRCPPSWTPARLLAHVEQDDAFVPVPLATIAPLPLVPVSEPRGRSPELAAA